MSAESAESAEQATAAAPSVSHRRRVFSLRRINPFLLILFTILGLGYSYLGTRLLSPLGVPGWLAGLPWLALAVPFGLFLWVPLYYWQLDEPTARQDRVMAAAFAGLGLLSFLFFYCVLRDAARLGWTVFGLLGGFGVALPGIFEGARGSLTIFGLAGVSLVLGYRGARRTPQVTEVEVRVEGLPEALRGLRVAQISDLHIGVTIGREFVERVVREVNALKPDLVALTGDIVDGPYPQLVPEFDLLKGIEAPLGRYYVTGNHEFYWDHEKWLAHVRTTGITALANSHAVVERGGARVVIAGVLDYWAKRNGGQEASDPRKALEGAPQDSFKILLAHQPKSALEATTLGYDLQLSGHTHGGRSCHGRWRCAGFSRSRADCTAWGACGCTSTGAPATGARRCGWALRRRSRCCGWFEARAPARAAGRDRAPWASFSS